MDTEKRIEELENELEQLKRLVLKIQRDVNETISTVKLNGREINRALQSLKTRR